MAGENGKPISVKSGCLLHLFFQGQGNVDGGFRLLDVNLVGHKADFATPFEDDDLRKLDVGQVSLSDNNALGSDYEFDTRGV